MNKIFFLFFITSIAYSQHQESEPTFFSEISERITPKDYYNIKFGTPKEVIVHDSIFLINSEIWVNKNIYNFKSPKKIDIKRYKNDEFVADEKIELDFNNKVLNYIGNLKYEGEKWYVTKFKYRYENKKKIKEKINDSGETYLRYTVEYDSLKNPILFTNTIIGTPNSNKLQSIKYDYKKNSFILMDFNYEGQLNNEIKGFINSDYIISKNEFGDITKMYWILTDKKEPYIHEIEYDYDKKGNWIKMVKSILSPDGTRKPFHKTYRKIEYKK